MTNEQKANELGFKFFPDEENIWARDNVEATKCALACLGMAQWKDEQAKQLYNIIIKLWDMLDWIDTYADLKINGSENDVYFSKIENKTKERFDFVKSDGYDLFINEQKITNYERNTTKTD